MLLQSDLMTETWGRPHMDPYCIDPYSVGNIGGLKIADGLTWT